jgi:hypothetical protein
MHVQLNISFFSLSYKGESFGVSHHLKSLHRGGQYIISFLSQNDTPNSWASPHIHLCSVTGTSTSTDLLSHCVTKENHLEYHIISTLYPKDNSKPITWDPSPLKGVHNTPSPSQRGTTHPTHGIPHPTQGHTTFLHLREEPHTKIMGKTNSWDLSHANCVLEDISCSCNHQHIATWFVGLGLRLIW